jgi:serine/threonine-protein kinase
MIGEGAMAQVFASSHPVLERRVAIKVLKKEACSDPHYVERFLEDARAAHGLDHTNIVRVLDVDDTHEQPFIVMELVDGSSLERWLPEREVEVGEAARIARDVALALDVAHRAGMVHRDIKPSNILIDRKTAAVKLTDFGAAKRERPGAAQLTEMGQRIGTPRYMAPEQIDGRSVDARADLFALGATLYELLANKPAFEGNMVSAVFHAILFSEPKPLAQVRPDAPRKLVELVERMLSKAPEGRPESAREVAAALDPFVTGAEPATPYTSTIGAPPVAATTSAGATTLTGKGGPAPGWRRFMPENWRIPPLAGTNRRVSALAGIAIVIVAIGAWWLFSPGSAPEPEAPAVATTGPETETDTAAPQPEPENDTTVTQPETEPNTAALEVEPDTAATQPEPDPAVVEPKPEPDATAPQPETEADTAALPPETEPETSAPQPDAEAETAALPPETEPGTTAPQVEAEAETAALQPELPTLECAAGTGPGCALAAQALSTLQPAASESPTLVLNRPNGVYLDEEYLVIETELPPDLGGYLYLDVLTDAGAVYHLLPEPMRENNEVPAGGEIRVGVEEAERRDGIRFWQVGEPFGEGYLLALVSEKPLYQGLRPIEESIADYQDVLLEALANPETGRKSAQVERIEFRPRGG